MANTHETDAASTGEKHTSQQGRRRKVGAILAGGLVLGVGAAVTLAAWGDSEFASSTFEAGTFTFQGSADGGTAWEDHDVVRGAAALSFATNPDNLSPNDAVYASYLLRVTGDPATVTPVAATFDGDMSAAKLDVEVREITGTTCDETSFNAAGAANDVTSTPFNVVTGTDASLCLQVVATDDLVQGDTGTVVWRWDAASQ
ncbi:MAG: SipW-dependent-type signal peptide-containing protein [Leucobacter sp.]